MEKEVMVEKTLSLQRFLTPIRLRYPWYIGSALWLAWIISLVIGGMSGRNTDRFGQLIGTDYAAFYTAGEIVRTGQSARLYDAALAIEIQTRLYGFEPQNFNPYLNPPFFAWLFIPFSMVPYPISPLLWMAFNLLCLFIAIAALGISKPWKIFLLSLTWIPAWSAISFGQNTFLSVLIISLTSYFYRRHKYLISGLILGLLFYKPQLLIGVTLLWILDWRDSWKSLLGTTIMGIALTISSYILMPEATIAYFSYVQKISTSLMTHPAFPIWNAHGAFTFWLGILPAWPNIVRILYLITASLGVIIFLKFTSSNHHTTATRFALSILLTIWVTPYLMIYDWAILLVPAVLLWLEYPERQTEWQVIFAILWVIMLFSGPLAAAQWRWLGWQAQVSVPVLGYIIYISLNLIQNLKIRNN